jgi:hypothetical protein
MRFVVSSAATLIAALSLCACDAFAGQSSCGTGSGTPLADKCGGGFVPPSFPGDGRAPPPFLGMGGFGIAGGSGAGFGGFGPAGSGGFGGVGGASGVGGTAGMSCDSTPESPSGLPPCADPIEDDAGVDDDAGAD